MKKYLMVCSDNNQEARKKLEPLQANISDACLCEGDPGTPAFKGRSALNLGALAFVQRTVGQIKIHNDKLDKRREKVLEDRK